MEVKKWENINIICKVLGESDCYLIICLAKFSFKSKGKIKTFLDKQKVISFKWLKKLPKVKHMKYSFSTVIREMQIKATMTALHTPWKG